jgi:hypothetical protein
MLTGAISKGVKWPVCEADHSSPTGAEVNEKDLPTVSRSSICRVEAFGKKLEVNRNTFVRNYICVTFI